ncbi:glycosyltransferase family 2 protein [Aliifodinibius sp. S!AR15-10]|nr:glycosyltransferase family 2 protein [Aliifodinibius sp. S!AR15-10]
MKRSIKCFNNQDYSNKELVVVDDGEQDLTEALEAVPDGQLNYVKLEPSEDNTLGKLRNVSLQEANGDYLVQWDDDDWYHPERISIQASYLDDGYDACCLSGALMHLDTPEFVLHPYVGKLPEGIPGSIMHRNDTSISYPHTRRAEDTVFLKEWMERNYIQLPDKYSHLFIRCYHGNNTWEQEHFLRRIRNSPIDLVTYAWHKFIRGNLFNHYKFQLSEEAQEAFEMYLDDSKEFGLVDTAS